MFLTNELGREVAFSANMLGRKVGCLLNELTKIRVKKPQRTVSR